MALALQQHQMVAAPPAVDVAQMQHDGQQVIQGLQGRVRQLEQDLVDQRLVNQQQAMGHDQEMFREVQGREQVELQLQHARAEVDQYKELVQQHEARVRELELKQAQDAQLVQAGREEIQVLERQVALFAQQLQLCTQRARALEVQIQQMALRSELQQQQILQQLKTPTSSDGIGTQIVAGVWDLFVSSLSLLKPELYNYK